MKALVLARRNLQTYAETPPAYIALFVFSLISSYLFALPLFLEGQATVHTLVDFAPMLLTLFVPALTMGLLAEELRSGTFETLATLPLEDSDIVLGKFLAFAGLASVAVAGLGFFALAAAALARPPAGLDWGEAFGTLLSLLLLAWALGAAGLFASSWGKSQVTAYLGAFAIGFALFLFGKVTPFLPSPVGGVAEFVGFDSHLRALAKGVVDLRDLLYFASLIFAFLFLTVERLRRKPSWFSGAGAALVLGSLAAFNLAAQFLHARADLSEGGVYSISSGTKETLRGLADTLLIRVYFTPRLPPPYSLHERYLRDLLAEYRAAAPRRVTVEFVDPSDGARKAEAQAAGVAPVEINVTSRDKFEVKQAYMGAVLLYHGKSAPIPLIRGTSDLEYELTRRVRALAQTRRKAVGFLTGHGERFGDPEISAFFGVLREQVDVQPVSLATAPAAGSLAAIWVLAPTQPLKPAELERLSAFSSLGKPIGLLLNRRAVNFATFGAAPVEQNLSGWLKGWGLEMRPGFVVDQQAEKIQLEAEAGPYVATRIQEYPFIPIVSRFDQKNPAVKRLSGVSFPFVHPIRPLPGFEGNYSSLADTSRDSWYTESADVSPARGVDRFKSGAPGPFSVGGVAVAKSGGGRLILLGTGYLVDPRAAGKSTGYSLLANLIDWSIQDDALLALRSKGLTYRPLRPLSDSDRGLVKIFLLLALPFCVAAAALLAFRRQRTRRAATAARYADA